MESVERRSRYWKWIVSVVAFVVIAWMLPEEQAAGGTSWQASVKPQTSAANMRQEIAALQQDVARLQTRVQLLQQQVVANNLQGLAEDCTIYPPQRFTPSQAQSLGALAWGCKDAPRHSLAGPLSVSSAL